VIIASEGSLRGNAISPTVDRALKAKGNSLGKALGRFQRQDVAVSFQHFHRATRDGPG